MGIRSTIVGQFRRPAGRLGALAGWVMQSRPSNRQRNAWTVDLLGVRPGDRVLEFGCGPGMALEACARRASGGRVTGIDHSQTMIDQARKRLRQAGQEDLVHLIAGGEEELTRFDAEFDKAYLVNVVQFLPDRAAFYGHLLRALKPGGLAATTYMPRSRNPTRDEALAMAEQIRSAMEVSGFEDIRTEELPLDPVPAVCVLGRRPDQPGS